MTKWTSKNFSYGKNRLCILTQLTEFLNENEIEDFIIIISEDNYLEIVYKSKM